MSTSIDNGDVIIQVNDSSPDHFRGVYTTLLQLQATIPTGNAGDYADVDAGVGTDIQRYIWDVDDAEWVLGGGAPLVLTDGNGTTANGTAVDLGGDVTEDADILIDALKRFIIKELGNNTFVGYYPDLGGIAIGSGDPTLAGAFTGVIVTAQDISFYSQGIAGANGFGFDFGQTNGMVISDSRATPKGIQTAASGYVTDPRSYTDKEYVDALVVGLLDDRGNYDASSNAYPSTGGSGTAGAILKGDLWTISVAGILNGANVTAGDVVRALVNTPGQTASNWAITENNIGYVPVPVTRQVSGRALNADITTAELRTDLASIVTFSINALASGSGVMTLTNMTNVEQIFPNGATVHLFKFDGTNYATVRITCRVSTGSASVNDPRLFMQYSTDNGSNWITIGAGTSASGDALSLTSTNNQAFTNWVALPAGAKADVLFRVAQNGGDGAADPAVCNVYVSFRT